MTSEAPYPYEADLDRYERAVAAAQREIALRLLAGLRDSGAPSARLAQVAAVAAILERLGTETDPIAITLVGDAFEQGAKRSAQQIAKVGLGPVPEVSPSSAAESSAVELQETVVQRLREVRSSVGRQVDDIYAKAGRRAGIRARLEGDQRPAIRGMIKELLQDRDIAKAVEAGGGFRDVSGRVWSLQRYCTMAVRTIARESAMQGMLERMAASHVNVIRWTRHGDACPICLPWLGRLLSLDGDTRDFAGEPVFDYADSPGLPAHPQCKCGALPAGIRDRRAVFA